MLFPGNDLKQPLIPSGMGGCVLCAGITMPQYKRWAKKTLPTAALFEVDGFRYRSTHPTRSIL